MPREVWTFTGVLFAMGFKKVYKVLIEIFPEVDSRALRAVAIEHQKDADAAVEAVLTEVIPFLTERSTISNSSSKNRITAQPPQATVVFANGPSSNDVLVENVKCQEEEQHVPFYDAKTELQTFHDANDGLHEMYLDSKPDKSVNSGDERSVRVGSGTDKTSCGSSVVLVHENCANAGSDSVSGEHACEETPHEVSQESSTLYECDQDSQLHLKPLEYGHVHATPYEVSQESSILYECDRDSQLHLKPLEHGHVHASEGLDYCLDSKSVHAENLEKKNLLLNTVDHLSPLISEPSDVQISDLEKKLDALVDTALNKEASIELVDMESLEDDSVLNIVVTRSGQVCSIDLLEEIIADARNSKKTLLSAVEIVLGLMKEVEAQEKAAEQAKEDAANGGVDILKRVDDLKQMLQHAKEANDMHAGEVYGEKAILATEVRELQSRLLYLSEERDRSLKIADEMRQNLEVRLAAAEKEINAAEKEKLEREGMARKALKNQEVIMENVVQEANILKQEAEANAKLREFLMDRGRVVDTLQGEISVICTDMRSLKEKFDERLPLSKVLTLSHTSCTLASSSSSSSKSMTSERMLDQVTDLADPSETIGKNDLQSCLTDSKYMVEEKATDDNKYLGEEGWEIFDNRDAYL